MNNNDQNNEQVAEQVAEQINTSLGRIYGSVIQLDEPIDAIVSVAAALLATAMVHVDESEHQNLLADAFVRSRSEAREMLQQLGNVDWRRPKPGDKVTFRPSWPGQKETPRASDE